MKTIPLEPIFENQLFQDSKPIIKYAVLNAVYLLCRQRKANEPLPTNLEPYLGLCNPGYYRNRDVCKTILSVVMPEICKIKRLKQKQVVNGHKAQSKKAVESRLKYQRDMIPSAENDTHLKITPVPSLGKKYHPGQSDPIAIKQAKKSHESDEEMWFKDK